MRLLAGQWRGWGPDPRAPAKAAWGQARARGGGIAAGRDAASPLCFSSPLTLVLETGRSGLVCGQVAWGTWQLIHLCQENLYFKKFVGKKRLFEDKHPSSLGKALSLQNTN